MCLGLFPFGERERGEIEFGLRFPGELTRGGDGIESGRLLRKPGREEHDKEESRKKQKREADVGPEGGQAGAGPTPGGGQQQQQQQTQ